MFMCVCVYTVHFYQDFCTYNTKFPIICLFSHLPYFVLFIACIPSQHVPHGTNGAVTVAGLLAAAAGGAVIGLTFVLTGLFTARCEGQLASKQLLAFPIATFAGLFGSVVDSILGATVQYSGFCAVRKKVTCIPYFLELFCRPALDSVLISYLFICTGGRETRTNS